MTNTTQNGMVGSSWRWQRTNRMRG